MEAPQIERSPARVEFNTAVLYWALTTVLSMRVPTTTTQVIPTPLANLCALPLTR